MSKIKWFRSHVERCLQDTWDVPRVNKDWDGDYPFRNGTAQCYVRVEPGSDFMVVRVFAYAATEVPKSAKLLTEINEIDGRCRTVSLSFHHGAVIVEQVLHEKAVKRRTLAQACESVGFVADNIGTMIATVFGGETPYDNGDAEISEEAS